MRTTILFAIAALIVTPASAHRYCARVDNAGKIAGSVPDVNSDRPEFQVIQEVTFLPSGERKRNVVAVGVPGFPICSMDECERYMDAMHLNNTPYNGMTMRTFCEER